MGIKEKNLPMAESLSVGDKVRIVTAAGNSKNIDASEIGGGGGGVLLINIVYGDDPDDITLDKTWKEIHDAFIAGNACLICGSGEGFAEQTAITGMSYADGEECPYSLIADGANWYAKTETGYPSVMCNDK